MSITINGATNTLTAASGLTIAGNTTVSGTLSATTSSDATVALATLTNSSTGTSAVNRFRMDCGTSVAVMEMYGSGFSGAGITGAPTTSHLALWTVSTQPISIGVNATERLRATTGGVDVTGTLSASSHILPTIDNTSNLGSAALGMKELFSDNGTINTSDARRKTEVVALSAAEINAAKQLAKEIGSFKFLSAVAEKGDAARLHIGMTVQRAIEIMEGNGLDPFAYSFICHDAWGDVFVDHPAVDAVEGQAAWTEQTQVAGDKYSFRVHELLLFMSAGFEARLSALEAA